MPVAHRQSSAESTRDLRTTEESPYSITSSAPATSENGTVSERHPVVGWPARPKPKEWAPITNGVERRCAVRSLSRAGHTRSKIFKETSLYEQDRRRYKKS
jgi:hypothetical protein